jgi:hypothetical protein
LSSAYKICPICQTPNQENASHCHTCGTSLAGVEVVTRAARKTGRATDYDFRFGEDDLQERPLGKRGQTAFTIAATALVAFVLGGAVFALGTNFLSPQPNNAPVLAESHTPLPTLNFATVTLGPPTATITWTAAPTLTPSETFTPTPCMQTIVTGDSLLGALARCGHRSRDVLPTVMAMNGMTDANAVQVGQEIYIPWPTPTIDPNLVPTETPLSSSANTDNGGGEVVMINESLDAFAPTIVPTLPAGVMWHTVQKDENLIVIGLEYNANAKTLSELNPEIDFARCDFGQNFGGPECLVALYEGQQVRVPAPPATPTLSPTPDPNATATPTITPTYNEPSAISPSDQQFFNAEELITLRWQPTGTLAIDETYRLNVEDVTLGITYTAYTKNISFMVPSEWRGREKPRHEFIWTVGVVNEKTPDVVRFQTAARTFVWQGLTETTEKK